MLDQVSSDREIAQWDADKKLLLRLHILRVSARATQSIILGLEDFKQLRNSLIFHHKYALEYLRIYTKLPSHRMRASLLFSTVFEVISPVIYFHLDRFRLMGK
jgi:hypothetical protein